MNDELLKQYPHLTKCDECDHVTCGKNIRSELKKHWPNTKFIVRYKAFAGGDEYLVSWEDGATMKEVEAVIKKFQNSHADETGDYWDYDSSEFNELFGGVKYVLMSRSISDDVYNKVREELSDLTDEQVRTQTYKCDKDDVMRVIMAGYAFRVDDVVHQVARSRSWYEEQPEQQRRDEQPRELPECGEIVCKDYSDKSFVVVGDTKPIKDELKRFGGRFNKKLYSGTVAGWVFPIAVREEVEAFLWSLPEA